MHPLDLFSFLTFFLFWFYNCIVPMGFLPRETPRVSPGKASCNSHATPPTVHAGHFSVSIIHQTLTWTTGSLTCPHMLMHTIARRVVWTPKESLHWKLTLGEKSLAAPEELNLSPCHAGPVLYQLIYIPTHVCMHVCTCVCVCVCVCGVCGVCVCVRACLHQYFWKTI